jgi:4-carboxymuconolactone decarboxylase
MKNRFLILFIFQLLSINIVYSQAYNISSVNNKSVQASKENFIGTVWVNMFVTLNDSLSLSGGTVTFEPKARTNWHKHATGQILIITDGTGYYQEKGRMIQIIKKGDVVKIPANVEHWHGASHQNSMTHIAISASATKMNTTWLLPVTDVEYNKP